MSDKQGSGSWAAAVAGGALGASATYVTASTALKKRGVVGGLIDKSHVILDHLNSPEKIQKIAEKHWDKVQAFAGHLENQLKDPLVSELPGIQDLEQQSGRSIDEVRELLGQIKSTPLKEFEVQAGELADVIKSGGKELAEGAKPTNIWEEAHGAIKAARAGLEKTGIKRSMISKVPGGIHTLTGAGAIIGAALAYMAISDISKSTASEAPAR